MKKLTGGVIHINIDNPRVRLHINHSEAVHNMTVAAGRVTHAH